jgi:hypothetical protein
MNKKAVNKESELSSLLPSASSGYYAGWKDGTTKAHESTLNA